MIDLHSLKEFLPKEYIKQRGSEKKIFVVCSVLCNILWTYGFICYERKIKTSAIPKYATVLNSERFILLYLFPSDRQDHKTCGEMTEIESKVKYVKLARSLPTYGVSFFLVKVRYKERGLCFPTDSKMNDLLCKYSLLQG